MQKPAELVEGGLLTEYETKSSVERKMDKSYVVDICCFCLLACLFWGKSDILLGTSLSPTVSSSSETVSSCFCLPEEDRKDTEAKPMGFLFSGLYFKCRDSKEEKKKELRLIHPRCRTLICP